MFRVRPSGGTGDQFAMFFKSLMRQFSWRHVTFLYHQHPFNSGKGGTFCEFAMAGAFNVMGGRGNENISHIPFNEELRNRSVYVDFLEKASERSRVIAVCAANIVVRDILLTAEELGMLDKGEYVFFNVDLFGSNLQRPWYSPEADDEENARARRAFQNVLTISSYKSEKNFNKFKQKVEDVAARLESSGSDNFVNSFVGYYYDAVKIFSSSFRNLLERGYNRSMITGENISREIWNKTHAGVLGQINIDSNGDRKIEFSLLDLKPGRADFSVVQIYHGSNHSFEVVGVIAWPGGQTPPPDVPRCGFQGELCQKQNPVLTILLSVSFFLLFVLLIASLLIFRHYKEEADIASMTWKIDADEIDYDNKLARRNSSTSIVSQGTMFGDNRQRYMRTVLYKGSVVAKKEISAKNINMNRQLLIELKQMKDLHHDHLVRFVGACFDDSEPFLITEYCPRGSLQDILEEDINLDWNFKYSLINDIVKGLSFIHGSEIGFHGNLKSSNCVVDSRFVLKLTDFGLHAIRAVRAGRGSPGLDSYEVCKTKLWTAPELLNTTRFIPGTQKGDVFAFSIIVHEIAERNGPWGTNVNNWEAQHIVKQVRDGGLRPSLDRLQVNEELCQLIEKCWAEDPGHRPDINTARAIIKRTNREKSGNIMDNLLNRMEQYANNLESLVEERTQNYLEEKRRCEDLLHELLPKSVARTLIHRETVKAESFSAVTIYFSDIVGFTNLSSASQPAQIFEMLNDLYTLFDSIIQDYDVYKVETIGDAYMVVSGLPDPNGDSHAREIARMSLKILDRVGRFKIRHREEDQLRIRIGLHTGPCVAGVVGIKMPRYCLFGDTVNTAARMESNGEALKIHMSVDTANLLQTFQTFQLEERGELAVKGKGMMTTYWLLGESQEKVEDTDSGLEMEVVTKPTKVKEAKLEFTAAPARSEYRKLKRTESKNRHRERLARPGSLQVEDERTPFTRFNSRDNSKCIHE